MIRNCCGSHDKPDPLLFIQVYRLLSFYSLVKPPKGSNVEGLDIFETLLSVKDARAQPDEHKDAWQEVLDHIIKRGEDNPPEYGVRHEHDYNVPHMNEYVQNYFAGFVARKIEKWTTCENCICSVTKSKADSSRDLMISSLNRGYLKYPSESLIKLLSALECATLQTIGQEQLNFYTFQHIVDNVVAETITFVGCEHHKENLTKSVINYYLIARTQILCKAHNKIFNEARKEEKRLRKLAKLVGKKDKIDNSKGPIKESLKKTSSEVNESEANSCKRKRKIQCVSGVQKEIHQRKRVLPHKSKGPTKDALK